MAMSIKEKIVVAMSGGVDSCAAALMLHEQGHDVIGISMQVWDYRKNGGNSSRATCCAPSDFDDARIIAEKADFPFYVFDFEDSFRDAVISPFVNSYLNGLTPNPCLNCNRYVKFKQLRNRAKALGANRVATGHYAQIKEKDDRLALYTSVDDRKDQTYFLYAMSQKDLAQTLFPIGDMKKPDVRKYLADKGFEQASKPESQDICFVSGNVGSFIEKNSEVKNETGKIVNSSGEQLGEHSGVYNYTVGQRRGLGISNPSPLYVLNIDSSSKEVRVGEKKELERKDFRIKDVNWISGVKPSEPVEALIKLRYRHDGILCKIHPQDSDATGANSAETTYIEFLDSWSTVSPGQAAVFYRNELEADGSREILGGGIIVK